MKMVDKKNISTKKSKLENDNLKDYLRQNLSEEFINSFNDTADDDFMKDALDGLESFSSAKKIHKSVHELNQKLHQSTRSKVKAKPFEFKQIFWYIIAVVIIIMLVLLAFAVIHLRK